MSEILRAKAAMSEILRAKAAELCSARGSWAGGGGVGGGHGLGVGFEVVEGRPAAA